MYNIVLQLSKICFFIEMLGIWGISPPLPIPGVNVKVPFWGKNMKTEVESCFFYFCEN